MMADADLIETCQYHWLLTIIIDTTISLALQLSSHNTNQKFSRKSNKNQKETNFWQILSNPFKTFQQLSKDSKTFCHSFILCLDRDKRKIPNDLFLLILRQLQLQYCFISPFSQSIIKHMTRRIFGLTNPRPRWPATANERASVDNYHWHVNPH